MVKPKDWGSKLLIKVVTGKPLVHPDRNVTRSASFRFLTTNVPIYPLLGTLSAYVSPAFSQIGSVYFAPNSNFMSLGIYVVTISSILSIAYSNFLLYIAQQLTPSKAVNMKFFITAFSLFLFAHISFAQPPKPQVITEFSCKTNFKKSIMGIKGYQFDILKNPVTAQKVGALTEICSDCSPRYWPVSSEKFQGVEKIYSGKEFELKINLESVKTSRSFPGRLTILVVGVPLAVTCDLISQ